MIRNFFINKKTGRIGVTRTALAGFTSLACLSAAYIRYTEYRDEQNKVELSQNHFVKYRISWRKPIDSDHFLLELHPVKRQKVNVWKENGYRKLWSVEIKQPQIHVVRNYTPLPLKHVSVSCGGGENDGNGNDNGKFSLKNLKEDDNFSLKNLNDDKFSLKVLEDDDPEKGSLMFYIKKYDSGEVARWLSKLPVGSEVEIRGPYVEYEFPEAPSDEIVLGRSFLNGDKSAPPVGNKTQSKTKYMHFDINFFTGGTGIVTPLQLLLTQDPFKGKIQVIHACGDHEKELLPLLPFIERLQSSGRLTMHYFDNFREELKKRKRLDRIVEKPYPFSRFGEPRGESSSSEALEPVFSLVVGPDGFISSVSGPKYELHQGPITGYLGQKGWDSNTVFKLS